MPSNVYEGSIQRFTYDWLIRFCELHPHVEDYDEILDKTKTFSSKYCTVSCQLAKLVKKYTPHFYFAWFHHNNNTIEDLAMPSGNKIVVIVGRIVLTDLVPGAIMDYNNKRIYFNSLDLYIKNSCLHPKEFTYLLKGCERAIFIESSLTEPVIYAKIWPLLRYCNSIEFDVKKLLYDSRMAAAIADTTFYSDKRKDIHLLNFRLREETVLPIVDSIMKIPKVDCLFQFRRGYSYIIFLKTVKMIEEKLKADGYTVDKDLAPSDCLRTISVSKETDNEVSIRYLDRDIMNRKFFEVTELLYPA